MKREDVSVGRVLSYAILILLLAIWISNAEIAYPQTRVPLSQIRSCDNWDEPRGTRPLLADVIALSAKGPDLTIRVPGYAPVVARLTKAGSDEGVAHATSSLSIELLPDKLQLRMGSFAQVQVVSGPAVVLPIRTNGYWRGCDSGVYSYYPSEGLPVHERWTPYKHLSVHACGLNWRLNGSRPAKFQACWHGTPVSVPEPAIVTFKSEVYKNSTSTVPCPWNSVCPAQ